MTEMIDALKSGNRAVLARAITLAESGGEKADALLRAVAAGGVQAKTIGFTGPPGSGKSTLINAFVKTARQAGLKVAVLAVDPSSPVSGGAILGDRTRMIDHTDDRDVFIRSISARGHLGGLCINVQDVVDVVAFAGWDLIVLETVGAGQSEVEIAEIADVKIVIAAPGLGDGIQAIKAGILEIADILVVNKADKDGAEETYKDLAARATLRDGSQAAVPVLKTTATEYEGVAELFDQAYVQVEAITPEARQARKRQHALKVISENIANRIMASLSDDLVDDILSRRKAEPQFEREILTLALSSVPEGNEG